jgi:hypothetical protein
MAKGLMGAGKGVGQVTDAPLIVLARIDRLCGRGA